MWGEVGRGEEGGGGISGATLVGRGEGGRGGSRRTQGREVVFRGEEGRGGVEGGEGVGREGGTLSHITLS